MPLNRQGVYYYSTIVFIALEVPSKKTGEIPPSEDKPRGHGLDMAGGSIAFSVGL
jgi:hypothetical protein